MKKFNTKWQIWGSATSNLEKIITRPKLKHLKMLYNTDHNVCYADRTILDGFMDQSNNAMQSPTSGRFSWG